MTPHADPPPTVDAIRRAIWATTDCTCHPTITFIRHRRGRTRVRAVHAPGCPIHPPGHFRQHIHGHQL